MKIQLLVGGADELHTIMLERKQPYQLNAIEMFVRCETDKATFKFTLSENDKRQLVRALELLD